MFSSSELLIATNVTLGNVNPFYYVYKDNNTIRIDIDSSNPVVYNDSEYSGEITLYKKGESIELIWNASDSRWYIIGSNSGITIN